MSSSATALAAALEKVAEVPFANMDFFAVREVVKLIHANPGSDNGPGGAPSSSPAAESGSDPVIQALCAALSPTQMDVLMRVLYCCLRDDCKKSAVYLRWHAQLFRVAGSGSIVRVLTSKGG